MHIPVPKQVRLGDSNSHGRVGSAERLVLGINVVIYCVVGLLRDSTLPALWACCKAQSKPVAPLPFQYSRSAFVCQREGEFHLWRVALFV